ncbi:hypothetical protein BDZ97DRAFT_506680 [Flammula alnicola]|nr:hypothetical protein BDZ97DRAFT_506680 [Flammula alnicola]
MDIYGRRTLMQPLYRTLVYHGPAMEDRHRARQHQARGHPRQGSACLAWPICCVLLEFLASELACVLIKISSSFCCFWYCKFAWTRRPDELELGLPTSSTKTTQNGACLGLYICRSESGFRQRALQTILTKRLHISSNSFFASAALSSAAFLTSVLRCLLLLCFPRLCASRYHLLHCLPCLYSPVLSP